MEKKDRRRGCGVLVTRGRGWEDGEDVEGEGVSLKLFGEAQICRLKKLVFVVVVYRFEW